MKSSHSMSKHIIEVISISASGRIYPPFFIVAGKRISSDLWFPETSNFRSPPHVIIVRLTKPNWFPLDKTVVKVSENGSMESSILAVCVNHVEAFIRSIVPKNEVCH